MTTENTTAGAAPEAAQPNININDLQAAVQIIDYAADQGAFKGWGVIEQVKVIRDRLNAFVVATVPKKAEPAPQAAKATPKKITKAPAGAKKSASVAKTAAKK
jgi:hypothetical protein